MILGCSIFLGCFFGTKPLNSPMPDASWQRSALCLHILSSCAEFPIYPVQNMLKAKQYAFHIWHLTKSMPTQMWFQRNLSSDWLEDSSPESPVVLAILTRPSNLAMNWTDKKSNASKYSSQKALGQHMSLRHFWVVGKHHQVQSKNKSLTRGLKFC